MDGNAWRKWYYHFGLELRFSGKNDLQGTCPFCFKEDHFFVYIGPIKPPPKPKSPGMFICQYCRKTSNHYGFMRDLFDSSVQETGAGIQNQQAIGDSGRSLASLARARGLLQETLRFCDTSISTLSGYPIIPSRNLKGEINNLYTAIPSTKTFDAHTKFDIRSAPEPIQQQLYGLEHLSKKPQTIYLVEGHWDRMALIEVLAHLENRKGRLILKGKPDFDNQLLKESAVVGTPGANIFKDEWTDHFKNKRVILIYDNDPTKIRCRTCFGKNKDYKPHIANLKDEHQNIIKRWSPNDPERPNRNQFLSPAEPEGIEEDLHTPCPVCAGTETTGNPINPGKDGCKRTMEILLSASVPPDSVEMLNWQLTHPNDIRDLLHA